MLKYQLTYLLVAIGFYGECICTYSEKIFSSIPQRRGINRWGHSRDNFENHKNKVTSRQFPAFLVAWKKYTRASENDVTVAHDYYGKTLVDDRYLDRKSTSRLFFSFNLKNVENEDEDGRNNLPSWARSLFKVSTNTNNLPNSDEENNKKYINKSRSILSLEKNTNLTSPFLESDPIASLINVEALLLASGLDEFSEELDSDFFSTPLSNKVKPNSNSLNKIKDGTVNSDESESSINEPPVLQQVGDFNYLIRNLQKNVDELVQATPKGPSLEISTAAELILKSATNQIEEFLDYASLNVSPDVVKNLILRAGNSVSLEAIENIVSSAESLARESGLDVRSAADQARASAEYTVQLVTTVNGLLSYGYIRDQSEETNLQDGDDVRINYKKTSDTMPKPLFHKFPSVQSIPKSDYNNTIKMGVEMASLSGAIYLNTIPETHRLDHAIVANGTAADVFWMVTDSIVENKDFNDFYKDSDSANGQTLVRTITLRGFDASDEQVDREKLLNQICTADPVDLGKRTNGVKFHKGLLEVAKSIYDQIVPYIDLVGPKHKIILNGHSIGGSLSILILILLMEEREVDYILDKVLRVFAFGSPPIAKIDDGYLDLADKDDNNCNILALLGLPNSIVYGYVQPWDPIVRLFSNIDPLYPLVGDLGEDGVTLYSSGPDRALRPITRAILESWENWPTLRENFSGTGNQDFRSIGVQHILLPDASRYITDRFVSVNIGTSPVESVIRIPSNDLLSALSDTFPLDTFAISYVPAALRSFIHHFYPAYGKPFREYFDRNKKLQFENKKIANEERSVEDLNILNEPLVSQKRNTTKKVVVKGYDWAETASKWILGDKM